MQDTQQKQDLDEERIESRVVKLEAISAHTIKALDTLQRRVDDGFREVKAEFTGVRAETAAGFNDGCEEGAGAFKEMMTEKKANFRVIVALYITTFIGLLGLLLQSAKLF